MVKIQKMCYKNKQLGCAILQATYTTAEIHLIDSNNGYSQCKKTWSKYEQNWYGKDKHIGCVMLTTTESHPFDSNTRYSQCENTWSKYKKMWCCINKLDVRCV